MEEFRAKSESLESENARLQKLLNHSERMGQTVRF